MIRQEAKYFVWCKGDRHQLSEHFSSHEFESQDAPEGSLQLISVELVNRLEKLRSQLGKPLYITSAYRSTAHQRRIRGEGLKTSKNTSTHELGMAVDISLYGHDTLKLIQLCEDLFQAVGIAKTFIHVDVRDDKKRRWTYS